MRHWRLGIAVLVGTLAASPASAAPVFYADEAPGGLLDIAEELTGLGSTVEIGSDLIVVGGEIGTAEITATVLNADSFEVIGTITATRSIGFGDQRLAAVTGDVDGSESVLLYGITDSEITEIASTSISSPNGFDRLGTEVAVNQQFVAVVDGGQGAEPDEIRILEISGASSSELTEIQTLTPGLSNTHIRITGSTLAISGVPPLGNVGHLVLYDLNDGSEIDRLDNVGGGPLVVGTDAIYVQRNQFFVQPSGSWTMVEFSGTALADAFELPTVGSALAVTEELILVGDPIRNQVLVLELTNSDWPFRFTQSIRTGSGRSADQFGASVGFFERQALVGVPGISSGESVLRGAVLAYSLSDGPVGCTVVGTPGDDEKLTGSTRRDTICGLAGNDRILGFSGDDVIYGGSGNDALLGNGGNDILYGEDGDDILNGSDGDDLLDGGDGDDTGNGGAGDDIFVGGPGRDKGNGGEGTNSCDAEQRFRC